MAEVLMPADDEAEVASELNARMTPQIGTRIPSTRPAEFGRVVSVGGIQRDLVTDSPTLVLEGFGKTESTARNVCARMLAELQAAGRDGLIGNVAAGRVRVFSLPANLPLPSVPDRFRYTATVSVDLRRSTV